MSNTSKPRGPANPWAPYAPSEESPWDLRRVVHLHRRAGFAATWGEIERDLKDGPKASIDRVLKGKAATQGVPEDFDKTADLLGESAAAARDPARLAGASSHSSIAGSCVTAASSLPKGARANSRKISFWRRMAARSLTLSLLVAK